MTNLEAWTATKGIATICNNKGQKERTVSGGTTYKCVNYQEASYVEKPRCMYYRPETGMCDFCPKREEKK